MHILTSRVGEHNAVVISQKNLARLMDAHVNTVKKAVRLLSDDNWIEVRQIGDRGTVNAYLLNDRVVWIGARDGLRYSLFSAQIIISADEQADIEQLGNQKPLRSLPRVGELQTPSGPGLPPPSEPSLPGMETDLPSARHDTNEVK
ncbi:hypothetical protein [Roseibium hamelinense]|uniref:hypothetical protein n=1 Tax=Roseibium hamelinense TaxID=150831 RepID=UPI001FCA803A|nr:hypothetical protein [Roseibium hamelinense]